MTDSLATAGRRQQEIEVKLSASTGFSVPDLTTVRGVATVSDPTVHHLDAVYYDTAALDLLHSRITLRRREGGKDAGWHLKLPPDAVGGAASSGRTEVHFDLSDELPDDIAKIVHGVSRGAPLQPVANIRTRRTVVEAEDSDGRALVEVADDEVVTDVSNSAGISAEPVGETSWREVEVELLDGPEDTVRLVAGRLTKAGAKSADIPSKLTGAIAAAGRAPLRSTIAGQLNRRSRASDVVVRGLARHRDALVLADVGMRLESSVALHASRAAGRRLRSALTVFRAVFDVDEVDRLLKSLRSMDRVLRPVRDNDVLLARLTGEIAEEPIEFAEPADVLLRQVLAERNDSAWDQVRSWLDRRQSLRLIQRVDAFVANPPLDASQRGAAGRLLPAMVSAAWSRVRLLADLALADPDDAKAIERVRRAAKSVRYAAELAGTALGDDPVVFAAAVEEIQEVLGEHRNALLVGDFLVELAADRRADGRAGFLYGRLHAAADVNVLAAVDDFGDAWDRADDGELIDWLR